MRKEKGRVGRARNGSICPRLLGRSTARERERERKNEQGPERTERFSVTLRNERGQGLSDTRERMAHSASSMDRCHSTGALLSI